MSGLAAIAEAHGNLARAEALLARARAAAPAAADFAARHARLLSLLSRPREAEAAADVALSLGDIDPAMLDGLGVVLSRAGRHADAAGLFDRATAGRPRHGAGWRNFAGELRHCGRFVEAEAAYDRAIAVDEGDAEAWLAKVGLRTQRADDDPTPRLKLLWQARSGDPDMALRLGHALAKTAEDLGDRDSAMRWLASAKEAKAAAVGHDPDRTDRLYAAAAATWQPAAPGPGLAGPAPVFVVGAPRTGTTLVERILSSHPALRSIGESAALSLAIKRLAGTRSDRVLDEETLAIAADLPPSAIGRAYLEGAGPGGERTVDKMPLNLLYAGLVHRALPDAPIIRVRRHPLDAVLANWRQLFAPRFGYYDHNWRLDHVARWIVATERLAAHWRKVLPSSAYLEIGYEEIVAGQEAATRRLLEHCGLPWDPQCLRFHENATPVATASAVQVRAPLHARSVDAWRSVVLHMEPAIAVLRDAGLIDHDNAAIGIAAAGDSE